MSVTEETRKSRSGSQVKDYLEEFGGCPMAYKLKRIDKVWERPAGWFAQGIAVHQAAEDFERSDRAMSREDVRDVFRRSYAASINRELEVTPNWNHWFSSGPYRGVDDITRRYGKGLEQTDYLYDYYTETAPAEVIWITPDGKPAIELGFSCRLGDVPVRGYIDQVITTGHGGIRVRDIKTGAKPGDAFQLAVYAEAVRQAYDVKIVQGDFWMARNGKPTVPYRLDAWPADKLGEVFAKADDGIRAEKFDPVPDPKKCDRCAVATSCPFSA